MEEKRNADAKQSSGRESSCLEDPDGGITLRLKLGKQILKIGG